MSDEANQSLESTTESELTYTESLLQPKPPAEGSEGTENTEIGAETGAESVKTGTEAGADQGAEKKETEPGAETTPAPIKVKFNHEEKEISLEEATTLIQKGMNYDKVDGRLKERDAEVARRFGNQGITTWEQLLAGWDAATQQREQGELDRSYQDLIRQEAQKYGADPEALLALANSLVSKHPAVIKAGRLEQENTQFRGVLTAQEQLQKRIAQDLTSFKQAYPDVDPSSVSAEVLDRCNSGMGLVESYQIHENAALKAKLAEKDAALKARETNAKNAASSPGSVTGQGTTTADYISRETFDQNKGDRSWMIKNLSKIVESRKKWK